MFKKLEILDEKDPCLRKKSVPFSSSVSKEERELAERMAEHLKYSQIEEYEKKYDLRPGVGLAFPQIGINKRLIVIVDEYEKGKFDKYIVINPKIISHSEEKICADSGEGCLSVNREVEGHVPRWARVTITGLDLDGNPIRIRAREDLAIAFQHEIDHLDGILFYDRINPKKRFYTEDEIRLI